MLLMKLFLGLNNKTFGTEAQQGADKSYLLALFRYLHTLYSIFSCTLITE